jgi:hypothetical protein
MVQANDAVSEFDVHDFLLSGNELLIAKNPLGFLGAAAGKNIDVKLLKELSIGIPVFNENDCCANGMEVFNILWAKNAIRNADTIRSDLLKIIGVMEKPSREQSTDR